MDTTYIIIAVALVLVVLGAVLWPRLARRKRSERLHDQFGSEYDRTVQTLGDEKKAQTELEDRQRYVKALDILFIHFLLTSTNAIWLIGLRSSLNLSTNRGRQS